MVPAGDLCSFCGCRNVKCQGFENNIKNLQGLYEGGQRKLFNLLLFLCFSQRLQRAGDRRILEKVRQGGKLGSLAKGFALIENNFHVAKHCVISKPCVQSGGLGILICELCSCSTSSSGCVFMRMIMMLTPQFPFLQSGRKRAKVFAGLRISKHYFLESSYKISLMEGASLMQVMVVLVKNRPHLFYLIKIVEQHFGCKY